MVLEAVEYAHGRPVFTLRNWQYVPLDPDRTYGVLSGDVYGSPRHVSGMRIWTAPINNTCEDGLILTPTTCFRLEGWNGEGLNQEKILELYSNH